MQKKEADKKRGMALSQILILVLGIVAISYAIGSGVEGVNAIGIVKELKEGPDASDPSTLNSPSLASGDKKEAAKAPGLFGKGGIVEHVLANAAVAAGIYFGVKMIAPLFLKDAKAVDAVSKAGAISYFVTKGVADLGWFDKLGLGGKFLGIGGPIWIGGLLALGIFLLSYKKTTEQRISFTCEPWDAPTGGKYCEECNKGSLPCTEYQCRSLGQACELINKGTTDEQCVWKNRNDVTSPIIQPWNDALIDNSYTYRPDDAISPPDRGVFVKYKGDCVPAFTPFQFGVILDEPGKCKIDAIRKDSFNAMSYYFGGSSTLKYNHTQSISLPGPEALAAENITLQNDGNFELHVRCQDANGNNNTGTFVFKYCVDKGPDTTPPLIISTNILNNTPIAFNQSSIDIELYVNEPAECRWNHDRDASFESMEGTMKCSSSVFEMNAQMLYKCSTTLTGVRDMQANNFYFRCKDKPTATSDRNVNTEGYHFVILGTQPLVIDSAGPEGVVKDSTESVKVTLEARTSAGYDEGDATCYYSESCYDTSGSKIDYTAFYYSQGTSSYTHSQDIWVKPGNYQCSIKCVDLGGNADTKEFSFKAESDYTAPKISRAYHRDDYLYIVTDEEAECVYSNSNCNYLFSDGTKMNNYENKEHFVAWDSTKTYYIKCKDKYERQPLPNACSIIVRPIDDIIA